MKKRYDCRKTLQKCKERENNQLFMNKETNLMQLQNNKKVLAKHFMHQGK